MHVRVKTSWDDGNKYDFKIAELLKEYDLPGIFFIPNWSPYTNIGMSGIGRLAKMGFEIGGHTRTHHQDLKRLTEGRQADEIASNRGWLKAMSGGQKIRWFCYPRGRYNETTIEMVKRAGFKYARTTLVGHLYDNNYEDLGENMYRIHPAVHVHPARPEYEGLHWLEYAINLFEEAKKTGAIYHIWGHSWEVSKFGLFDELDVLFKYIASNNG